MKRIGLVGGLGVLLAPSAYAATEEPTPTWHVFLGVIALAIVGAVIFAIVQAVKGSRAKAPVGGAALATASVAAYPPDAKQDKFCPECGESIRARAEICPKCGVRQPMIYAAPIPSGRSKLTAALFALLLGGIGMHKFYLGRTGQGVVYLMFCWTLIPAMIALVEGIVLLSMSEPAFQQKYASA